MFFKEDEGHTLEYRVAAGLVFENIVYDDGERSLTIYKGVTNIDEFRSGIMSDETRTTCKSRIWHADGTTTNMNWHAW